MVRYQERVHLNFGSLTAYNNTSNVNISKTGLSFTIDDNATLNKYKNQFTTSINVASNETLIFSGRFGIDQ